MYISHIITSRYPKSNRKPLTYKDICTEAKIISVADIVEAMATHRPYRPAMGVNKALEEITQNRGVLYDPQVVDICLSLFNEKGFQFKQQ